MRFKSTLNLLVIVAVSPFAYSREKIDVIVLENNDRITGEIKQLENGLLTLPTDFMGTR